MPLTRFLSLSAVVDNRSINGHVVASSIDEFLDLKLLES